MALVIRLSYNELLNFNKEFYRDPRVQHLPLIGSPVPALIVLTIYVLFVKKWGPNWMANRKPFDVKFLIRIHNALQILLNTFVFGFGIWNSYLQQDFNFSCQGLDLYDTSPVKMRLLFASYVYYITKYLDLFDTIFFVLRKKNSQISFLHVYHHAIMVMAVWIYITFLFGAHPTMLGVINSFVHMIMYSYYLASSMDLKTDLTPWKKRITQIQILQFCYLVFHFSQPVFNNHCKIPFMSINVVAILQNIFMAAMFSDFYYKAYVKRGTNKN